MKPNPLAGPIQSCILAGFLSLSGDAGASAQPTSTPASKLPVREVTVFKDGHAFVIHEGRVAAINNEARLDYLPAPVIGTFWTYSTDSNSKVVSVRSGRERTDISRTALTIRELLEANVGAEAVLTQTNGVSYPATILGFPSRSSEELAATSPSNSDEQLPAAGDFVLLKTHDGTRAVPIGRIEEVTFKEPPATSTRREEFRNFLHLSLEGQENARGSEAGIGLMYLQKGIRWIPSYQLELDGNGRARVRLQATIVNQMINLTNVTLHLVIGVPSFQFKDTIDPIALQETVAQLSAALDGRGRTFPNFLNNAIMTQSQYFQPGAMPAAREDAPEPNLPEGAKNEDLYVFTLRNITLQKGERIVLPISESTAACEDVFTLDVPVAPPADLLRSIPNSQQNDLARLYAAPRVIHKVRVSNTSSQPFTTAPVLVFNEGRMIAQGMMTYAPRGGSTDVTLTTAIDVQVKKTDVETDRTPNALQNGGNRYMRIGLKGSIILTNRRAKTIDVEVSRDVLGHVDSADSDGTIEMINVFEARDFLGLGDSRPAWSWSNWPWWWHHVNGAGRITWKITLEPGKPYELNYGWHYFWM